MRGRNAHGSPVVSWGLYGALATLLGTLGAYVCLCWDPLVSYLASVNVVALVFFGLDKWRAQRNGFRIPESVLFGLVAAGGSPLGYLARHLFRHKTKKVSFRVRFWLIVVLQVAAVMAYWYWCRPGVARG